MKKKSILILLFISLIISTSRAQTCTYPSIGFRAGINFQSINTKNNGKKMANDIVTKFHVGINTELPIATNFYIQPGLLFTEKGGKISERILGQPTDVNLSYLELPINLLYKTVVGKGKLLFGLGPYIAYGIGGNSKTPASGVDKIFTFDVKFKNTIKASDPNDKTYYKPIDAGANILFGYELNNKFSVQLNAQLGLTDIHPKNEKWSDKLSEKNTGFGISVGYRL